MPRVNLDGYSMNKRSEEMEEYYFSVPEIIDSTRPPLAIK